MYFSIEIRLPQIQQIKCCGSFQSGLEVKYVPVQLCWLRLCAQQLPTSRTEEVSTVVGAQSAHLSQSLGKTQINQGFKYWSDKVS